MAIYMNQRIEAIREAVQAANMYVDGKSPEHRGVLLGQQLPGEVVKVLDARTRQEFQVPNTEFFDVLKDFYGNVIGLETGSGQTMRVSQCLNNIGRLAALKRISFSAPIGGKEEVGAVPASGGLHKNMRLALGRVADRVRYVTGGDLSGGKRALTVNGMWPVELLYGIDWTPGMFLRDLEERIG